MPDFRGSSGYILGQLASDAPWAFGGHLFENGFDKWVFPLSVSI